MPLPGTPVVHPKMLASLRPIPEGAMLGEGRLLRYPPDDSVEYDSDTLQLIPPTPVVLWAGRCRYQPHEVRGVPAIPAGERIMTTSSNQLTLPWDATYVLPDGQATEPHVDDVWEMTASNDPTLVGKTFRVTLVAFGELQAERRLLVEDYETPRRL